MASIQSIEMEFEFIKKNQITRATCLQQLQATPTMIENLWQQYPLPHPLLQSFSAKMPDKKSPKKADKVSNVSFKRSLMLPPSHLLISANYAQAMTMLQKYVEHVS